MIPISETSIYAGIIFSMRIQNQYSIRLLGAVFI